MKRHSFVANSSSCSFMIYGVCLDRSEAKELILKNCKQESVLEKVKEWNESKWAVHDGIDGLIGNLEITTGDPMRGEDYLYIGASWDSIGDNETKLEFMGRVSEILTGLFGEIALGTHEDAWYDG